MFLCGDIGGTSTKLALFENKKELKIIKEKRFASSSFSNFTDAIKEFLKDENIKISVASFGIAGPVRDGKCRATNMPWIVDIDLIKKEFKWDKVYLINDLEANAYGIEMLKENELLTLNEGDKNAKGNRALIAAGTGLGEAGLYFDGKKHIPFACEGGHTDFSPTNEDGIELLRYLQKKYQGHVSCERVISGMGINNIYRFLADVKKESVDKGLDDILKKEDQPQILITKKAIEKESRVCEKTIDWFISLYGSETGNLALKIFAIGGIYIGGGIAPKIIEIIKKSNFIKSFADKGRFENLLLSMPVRVILNDNAALLGAARYADIKK